MIADPRFIDLDGSINELFSACRTFADSTSGVAGADFRGRRRNALAVAC
jgi:hypothetical protein